MAPRKNQTGGAFAELKVTNPTQSPTSASHAEAGRDNQWRYIRLTYPNGVTLTLPPSIEPDRLASFINLI